MASKIMVAEEEEDNPNSPLRRIIHAILSLISLSHTIRVFSLKWQLIRNRLHHLHSGLITMQMTNSTSHHQPFLDFLSFLSHILTASNDLASRCLNVSYSGKLLMQSDLDKIVSNLDVALNRFTVMHYSEGIISGGLALVVSKPVIGASKEDIRFYVKDLFNRLKIGDSRMKRQALLSLNEALSEDDKYVKIVVDLTDFVLTLVSCLDSTDSSIQEEAVVVVGLISGFDCYKGVLVVSGVIAPLVRVIESGSFKAKDGSIRCLMKLTESGDNAWALSAHGGVTALLNLCGSSDADDGKLGLIGPCCWVLRNVVVVEEIKRFIIEEGAVSTFIKLINKARDETGQIGSAEFLQSLAFGDESVAHLVVKQGAALALIRILDPNSSFSFKLRETAVRAVENLCFCCLDHVHLLISYGFLDELLFFLRNGDVSMQELAFKSASRLCGTSEEARKAMGDAGFMAEFVKFLEAKSYEIREIAAEALCSMIMVPRNRKKFSNDDHNIGIILQLLDPKEGNSGNFKFLLSILLSLSSCNHAKKLISHSEYVKNIQKLAEAGVIDAKKIMKKLSTNKFKSLLNGIWHS